MNGGLIFLVIALIGFAAAVAYSVKGPKETDSRPKAGGPPSDEPTNGTNAE